MPLKKFSWLIKDTPVPSKQESRNGHLEIVPVGLENSPGSCSAVSHLLRVLQEKSTFDGEKGRTALFYWRTDLSVVLKWKKKFTLRGLEPTQSLSS